MKVSRAPKAGITPIRVDAAFSRRSVGAPACEPEVHDPDPHCNDSGRFAILEGCPRVTCLDMLLFLTRPMQV